MNDLTIEIQKLIGEIERKLNKLDYNMPQKWYSCYELSMIDNAYSEKCLRRLKICYKFLNDR